MFRARRGKKIFAGITRSAGSSRQTESRADSTLWKIAPHRTVQRIAHRARRTFIADAGAIAAHGCSCIFTDAPRFAARHQSTNFDPELIRG
jgi:hypothetical protein